MQQPHTTHPGACIDQRAPCSSNNKAAVIDYKLGRACTIHCNTRNTIHQAGRNLDRRGGGGVVVPGGPCGTMSNLAVFGFPGPTHSFFLLLSFFVFVVCFVLERRRSRTLGPGFRKQGNVRRSYHVPVFIVLGTCVLATSRMQGGRQKRTRIRVRMDQGGGQVGICTVYSVTY